MADHVLAPPNVGAPAAVPQSSLQPSAGAPAAVPQSSPQPSAGAPAAVAQSSLQPAMDAETCLPSHCHCAQRFVEVQRHGSEGDSPGVSRQIAMLIARV